MKNRRWWGILAIALILGGGLWLASDRRPTGPAEGVEIQRTELLPIAASRGVLAPEKKLLRDKNAHFTNNENLSLSSSYDSSAETVQKTLRVATFNLHGGKGLDGREDLSRSAKLLENLDFIALQEARGPGFLGGDDQPTLLGKQIKMAWLFAPAVRQWLFMESGNGLLTSLPVTFWQRIPLQSHRDYSYRNVVLVGLKQKTRAGEERVIHILATHVNRRYDEDRQAQLRAVLALFQSLQEPAILLGDLNSNFHDPQIAEILRHTEITDAVGKILGTNDDSERIDWIFCRGLTCLKAGIVRNDASDHPLVWAELE
jgi:endonuclease/exonuclease/phosphatase family metal-dependent hydrolase